MGIVLGAVEFDAMHTVARERHEEVGGRDARCIEITGVIAGAHSIEAVEAMLDEILQASSAEDYGAALSLRAGRRLWVRRVQYRREVSASTRTGSFLLMVEAKDPFEESVESRAVEWQIGAQHAEQAVMTDGNGFALPVLRVTASGTLINPGFSDGTRSIIYSGAVGDGETLVFDSNQRLAMLDGRDVTAYTSGLFPRISPGGTTLCWSDGAESSHTAAVTVELRDRWW